MDLAQFLEYNCDMNIHNIFDKETIYDIHGIASFPIYSIYFVDPESSNANNSIKDSTILSNDIRW